MKSEKPQPAIQESDPLIELSEEFRTWRNSRTIRSKIPEELWQRACELEPTYGFGTIAHVCRLNYVQFRRRLGLPELARNKCSESKPPEAHTAGFLDIGLLGPAAGDGCRIEVDVQHKRMHIHLQGSSCSQAAVIAKALWEVIQ